MHILCLIIYISAAVVQGYDWIEEGGYCRKRNGETGKCIHFSNCSSAIQEVRQNGRPEICSFSGIYPIVCCREENAFYPNEHQVTRLRNREDSFYFIPFNENSISLKKCREYHPRSGNNIETYGNINIKIKQYSHVALLGYIEDRTAHWKCAGSLISEKFILTSARCASAKNLGRLKFVRLGQFDTKADTNEGVPQISTVKNTYAHPDFQQSSTFHDIGLVQLDSPVEFTDYVKPVCLTVTKNLKGTYPEAAEFATTWFGQRLETDYLKYVSNRNCKKIYEKYLRDDDFENLHICAERVTKQNDTCHDHMSGPLQINNIFYEFNNFPEIVGIYSFGKSCTTSSYVFTKVYPYVSWIEKIVWPYS